MGKDASQALGGVEIAGTCVSPRGLTKKMTLRTAGGQVAGMVGDVAAGAMAGKGTPNMPDFGRMGYLAASETELALTKTSQMSFLPRPKGDALVKVPRSEVESVTIEDGRLLSQLTLSFTNGVKWEFEIPRAHRKTAKGLVSALGGSVS
jgi:hypothetical protein